MPVPSPNRLCVAAIDFLNPAPLMWDFEHRPHSTALASRYQLHYTQPSQCAVELQQDRADLGLIPIAALTPELAIVPGCAIASLDHVRSIQLIVKLNRQLPTNQKAVTWTEGGIAALVKKPVISSPQILDHILAQVSTLSADIASRSSLAYAQILFHKFIGTRPAFLPAPANPLVMLRQADAALLIGDPALLALEARAHIESQPGIGPCLWLDLAHEWRTRTGLPWVAAVWAARPESLTSVTPDRLVEDLQLSRDRGVAHIPQLVKEWKPRIALPARTIRHYLTHNIHYTLDSDCIAAIELFRRYAAEASILPPLPSLRFL